jgi:hypothetical protein
MQIDKTYYGVYRILANGQHKYVGRTCTANQKLAEEIAADLSRGEIVTPTGAIAYVRAAPHIAKAIALFTERSN